MHCALYYGYEKRSDTINIRKKMQQTDRQTERYIMLITRRGPRNK